MGYDDPLLGSRPGSATKNGGSGPITTRMASVFSLALDEGLDVVPTAIGRFLGGLESRIYRSGFSSTGFYRSVKPRMYFRSVVPTDSSPSSQAITTS